MDLVKSGDTNALPEQLAKPKCHHCQHRLLAQAWLTSCQVGFLLYVPILNREYLEQIPTDNFSDKLGLVVLVGGGCICHHLTVEETGEVKAAEVRELNWFTVYCQRWSWWYVLRSALLHSTIENRRPRSNQSMDWYMWMFGLIVFNPFATSS